MRAFLEATGNPPEGDELLVAGPETLDWFAVFSWRSYESLGLSRAGEPDAVELARAIQAGTAAANAERARRGDNTLDVLGWRERPKLDARRRLVEWAVESRESDGRAVVNHYVGMLADGGVVLVELVSNPEDAASHREAFRGMVDGMSIPAPAPAAGWAAAILTALLVAVFLWWRRSYTKRQGGAGDAQADVV